MDKIDFINKLILSIINGNIYYQELKKKDEKLSNEEALKIINCFFS